MLQASVFLIKNTIIKNDLHLAHWKWVSKFENVNVTLQKQHTKNSHHFKQQNIKNLKEYYNSYITKPVLKWKITTKKVATFKKPENLDFVKMSKFVHLCFHNFFVTASTCSSGYEFKNILLCLSILSEKHFCPGSI